MDSNSWEIVDTEPTAKEGENREIINDNESDSDKELARQSSRYGQNVKNYETEWRDLVLLATEVDRAKLKEMAVSGELKVSKFRSVCWNVLLGTLNHSPETWIEQRTQHREHYHKIKQKHILNPHDLEKIEKRDNPLSQSKDSVWNQHFRDTELRNLIRQDVVRTNPNVDYYRKENVQDIMIDILFCYAREFPSICYRQGMHEILAPLIFVLHSDHQNLAHIQEETEISLDSTLEGVLNSDYLEADSYHLFGKIMNSLELFYRINDMTISESGQLENLPDRPDSPKSPKRTSEIEVVHQLNLVRDKIFAKQDLHLHNHLLKLEIPLALFGIRWLRLMFGREFNLLDLLILWDAIFGVGDDLEFTYYIVVAMLIHVRDRLLSSDYTSCLTLLMRYPQNADVMLIIKHALYMKSPDKYQCPPNAFVYVVSSMKQHHIQKQSPLRSKHHPKIFPSSAMVGLAAASAMEYRGKLATPVGTSEEIRQEAAKVNAQQLKKSHSQDDGIVEGYKLNDPEVMKMKLHDSYNIMSVSRMKLLQYLSILRKHIPGNQIDELHQTLDGIEELCSLLKPKHPYLFNEAAPVDPAFEADDEDTLEPGAMSSNPFPVSPRSFPMNVKKPNKQTEPYEVPNNRVSKNASQLLQSNRREVEMNVIRHSAIGYLDPSQYPSNDPVGERRSSE